ncbi:flavin-containing amine oxidoreductase [Xylariomycetidae sp. FL2044]|nr:flavin-containing amine oxidoreductase [Xylariomycetidae sp. FL2044]
MHWLLFTLAAGPVSAVSASSFPLQLQTKSDLHSRLANVHVAVDGQVEWPVTYTYGSCSHSELRDVHHVIGESPRSTDSRLVWIIPEDVKSGCISAWDSEGTLVGRSIEQSPKLRKRGLKKRGPFSVPMDNSTGIDASGPWFDGVEFLQSKNLSAIDVAEAKSKEVAIVGAGMAGLMTFLILHQSGLTNVSILEASQRFGGRVHTAYLSGGPFDYSYQEMGPMRFPETYVTSTNETYNITDHQLVFQLAAEMNSINNHDKNFSVDFIPWIQSNSNGFYYHDGIKLANGLPPTIGQVAKNSSLRLPSLPDGASTQALSEKVSTVLSNETFMVELATNMHRAHKDFLDNGLGGLGGDVWSEFAYLANYLGASLNDTDIVAGGYGAGSFWNTLYEGLYFSATTWRTIDGGLNRLPLSFHPLVDNVTSMDTKIERVQWMEDEQKVNLQWRHNYTDRVFQNSTFDYAIMAMPFLQVQRMRLPKLPATISNAIQNLPFESACKVALEYKTRFWEHYENPIIGGQTDTDIPGIGSINYPSYCLNCTGPASILATYASGDWSTIWVGVSEAEHVQYVVDAMVEIHGEVAREQYTGNYNRRCWKEDQYEGVAWTSPTIGQHQLYIPEYFKTYNNMIFVGEHTSYTHSWISSALESGVRGAVQMLLELGLVDEAKAAVEKWAGRWIDVVSR